MELSTPPWSRLAVDMAGSWGQAPLLVCSRPTFRTAGLEPDIEIDPRPSVLDTGAVVPQVQFLVRKFSIKLYPHVQYL